MRKLTRFWRAFERIPGLAAIPAYWEHYCGPDYPLIRPFLRATELAGATYPCTKPCIQGCCREIVDYGDGEIAAVCRHPWYRHPDVPLTLADTLLQRLDIPALTKAIARPLGFRWQSPVEQGHGAWGIGLIGNGYGIEHPVILLVHSEQDRFRSVLHQLLSESLGRFVLLAPTARHKDLHVHETLTRHEIRFHSLEEHIGADDGGQFVAIQPLVRWDSSAPDAVPVTPVAERAAKVKAFLAKHALTIKEMLVILGLDYRDFKRWRKGELPDTSLKSKKIESLLHFGPGVKHLAK